jgi:predicted nucleic acid-binding Zn ribbon protein
VSEGDLSSFESSIDEVFRRLGLPDPVLMSRLTADWEQLAGSPWSGHSTPLFIQGKTLVVEADSPSMVAFLRYGSADLIRVLGDQLGDGVVTQVEVRAPLRR